MPKNLGIPQQPLPFCLIISACIKLEGLRIVEKAGLLRISPINK